MLAIASQRTQGITGTSDMFVAQGDVPGQFVQIGTGSALVRAGNTPVSQQTYSAFAQAASIVGITPTSSGSGRSDLVVCRVEDPYISGSPWQAPSDPALGSFVKFRVIQGVPPGTTTLAQAGRGGDSAIVLARIDIPASTGTITQGMITDLRQMAQPRQKHLINQTVGGISPANTLTSGTWALWPGYAPGNIVPEWATHANITFTVDGIYTVGPCDGGIRIELWGPNAQPIIVGAERKFDYDIPVAEYGGTPSTSTGGGAARFGLSGGAYGAVSQFRGQYAFFRLGAYVLNRSDRSPVTLDEKSYVRFEIDFQENPI
jgi:hypothetical protein